MPKMTQSTRSSLHPTGNSVKSPKFDPPIPGAVEDNRSNSSLRTWEVIVEEVGLEGEIRQSEIAEEVGCSVRTVQRLLKDFRRCNLIEYTSYNGQGKGIRLENIWLEKAEEIQDKRSCKRKHDQERKYLRSRYTRDGRLRTSSLDCKGNLEQKNTKDRDPGRDFSIKNPQNTSSSSSRLHWLHAQNGSQKTSSRRGFQEVVMWDLRTASEDTDLSPKAVKPLCDRFWVNVKDKTLRRTRSALRYLKERIGEFVKKVENEDIDGIRDLYRLAEKFISYEIMELVPGCGNGEGRTHETPEEDKEKRNEVRSRGASPFVSKIAPGIVDTLGSDGSSDASDSKIAEQFLNEGHGDPVTTEDDGDNEKLSKKQKRAVKRWKNYDLSKEQIVSKERVKVSQFEKWIAAYEQS